MNIRSRAEEYIKKEKNREFALEVEELLKRNDANAENELNDRFYKDLDFGTGGLRGVIGGGFNRMNTYTVQCATQGLANYINGNASGEKSVAIAYDSRRYSKEFARTAALNLASNGIKSFLFTSLRPTPELSYAVRQLQTSAGIVITASHNPAEYNGYKVYWGDGAQITPPHDRGIIEEVRKVSEPEPIIDQSEAEAKGLLKFIDSEIDAPYIAMILDGSLRPDLVKKNGKDLNVVYTPLHGAGKFLVERTLSEMGVPVFTVPEQAEPDGAFPTVDFPNPEIAPAMSLALDHARKRKADIVLGTDPDSDRLGIAVPIDEDYTLISGNQLGALILDYILCTHQKLGTMPKNPAFINTIVTTNLQNRIAASYSVADFKVLTGFKYIGEKMREFEEKKSHTYLFGCEESYGYLVGTAVRDKDAVSASAMAVEMALWNLSEGRTVIDHLNDIYRRFGYYEETLIDRYFKGESGGIIMEKLMGTLRSAPPSEIGGIVIKEIRDYKTGEVTECPTNRKEKTIDLPPSNVLQFLGEDGSMITARPSGTEPKIKFYVSCTSESADIAAAKESVQQKTEKFTTVINEIIASVEG